MDMAAVGSHGGLALGHTADDGKAGIKDGDVIIKVDGGSVSSVEELVEALSYFEAGETIEITVKTRESGYEEQQILVTLSNKKEAGIR